MAKKLNKKTSNPLHFLSQLVEQSEGGELSSPPPRIVLLQSSHSLQLRLDASSTLSSAQELDVYERAGVRTPAETARRDFLGGTLWLKYLVEEIIAQQHQSANNTSDHESSSSSSIDCRILWIATTSSNREGKAVSSAICAKYPNVVMEVLHPANDPWGWNDDDDSDAIGNSMTRNESTKEDDSGESTIRLDDLNHLSTIIQERINRIKGHENPSVVGTANTAANSAARVVVVWENLSPLLLNHGVASTLRLVQSCCRGCLVLLPVLNELLTPVQHTRFEDAAWACLWLNQGEMTLIRKGVRETGNVVRESFNFDLVPTISNPSLPIDGTNNIKYKVVMKEKARPSSPSPKRAGNDNNDQTSLTTVVDTAGDVASSGRIKASRPGKIQLRLEPEHGESSGTGSSSQPPSLSTITMASDSSATSTVVNRPRIYLQDDDPEFDDLDEEDPDDDLDI